MPKHYLVMLILVTAVLALSSAFFLEERYSAEKEVLAQEGLRVTGWASRDNTTTVIFTSCTDNDGEKADYRGQVVARYTYGTKPGTIGQVDQCRGESKVEEFTCVNNKPTRKVIRCAAGCKNGACQKR